MRHLYTTWTAVLALALLLMAGPAAAQEAALGDIDFPNSGAPEAQDAFLRGVLLLHSFEYDDAREAFVEARTIDPGFAMAYWGEAMTHNHPVWNQRDRAAGLAALEKLAPTPAERIARAGTERERGYLQAVEVLYGEGEKAERDEAYAAAMWQLHERYPDDLEAASFFALSLLGTTQERDFRVYMQAAAEAEEVFARNPNHPGAAHYLIHAYDDPIHAPLGLRAARVYSEIAPDAAHALHMPTHIFVALGQWDGVVALNERSWEAAEARIARKGLTSEDRGYHALWWLTYGYLQQGRYEDAARLVRIAEADVRDSGSQRARTHLVVMRAAYIVDAEAWDDPVAYIDVEVDGQWGGRAAASLFVDGLSALRRGDQEAARAALSVLAPMVEGGEPRVVIAEKQLRALILLEEGEDDQALGLLSEAAEVEDAMSFAFGPPMPVKPAHELHGEVLLELGRPGAAMHAFAAALERTPGRTRAVLGLARAARQAGDEPAAAEAYRQLRDNWERADADLPERGEIDAMLGSR